MWKALAFKEIRECLWMAAAALAVYLYLVARHTGWDVGVLDILTDIPGLTMYGGGADVVPLVGNARLPGQLATVSALLAIVLGFRQTVGESLHGTYALLLHLPISRIGVVYTKLVSGLTVYLACAAVPIVLYSVWAATPGTHASPFYWSMTVPTWSVWFSMTLLYLAAFLSGLRPARWYGSRLAPLVASILPVPILMAAELSWWLSGLIVLTVDVLLVICIQQVSRERDYS
jgi:hypothetical protein